MSDKMKTLITGITGFAGWHLYSLLSNDDNYEIFGIHKAGSGSERFNNAKIIECNVMDSDVLEDVIKEIMPDCIYHLAAYVHVGRTEVNPTDLFQTNMIGTLNLLNVVKKYVPKSRIVIAGSAEEYGFVPQEKMPIKESFGFNPQNLYGLSKKFQEEMGVYFNKVYNLDIVFTRSFHYCGPFQPLNFVFSDFASQTIEIEKSGKTYIQVGNLKAARDFTDIRDVVSAYKLIMEKGVSGDVYNVCSGKAIQIEEVLRKFLIHAKRDIEIKIDESKLRPLDVPVFVGDNTKLINLGWRTHFTIDQTIKDILYFWRKQKG